MLYQHRQTGEQVDITCLPDPTWSLITRQHQRAIVATTDVDADWAQVPNQTIQLSARAEIGSSGEG